MPSAQVTFNNTFLLLNHRPRYRLVFVSPASRTYAAVLAVQLAVLCSPSPTSHPQSAAVAISSINSSKLNLSNDSSNSLISAYRSFQPKIAHRIRTTSIHFILFQFPLDYGNVQRSGIFAILKPTNRAARDALSQVAERKLNDESWNPNARKNIVVSKEPVQVSTYSSGCESDGGTGPPKTLRPVFKGCHILDLDLPPSQPDKGWLIGGGRFSGADLCPDILLTERKSYDRVSSRHARLAHNFASGALVITASDSSDVLINGQKLVDGQLVIHGRTTSLGFGDLMYTLEVRKYDADEDYRNHLRIYKQNHAIADDDYPSNLLATPADSDLVTKNYIVKNPVGDGATSVVYAAHDRTNGNVFAIKKIRRTAKNAKAITRDIKISRYIGEHPRICHLIDVIAPGATDPSHGYQSFGMDEIFLVYTPLASWTVQDLIIDNVALDDRTREEIFWQLLEGIEFLHSIEIMHRDIKPHNMAVISVDPDRPEARLIDFGIARKGLESREWTMGTKHYMAPEMWSGLENRTNDPYNDRVDIFAFGLSMYQFLCQQLCHWDRIDQDANEQTSQATLFEVQRRLFQSWVREELKNSISVCIAWKPQSRPSARYLMEIRDDQQSVGKRDQSGTCDVGESYHDTEDRHDGIAASMGKFHIAGPECSSRNGVPQRELGTATHESSLQDPTPPVPVRGPGRWDASGRVQAYQTDPISH